MICAYRTVSTVALQVLAGALPIDLLAKERKIIDDRRIRDLEGKEAVREEIIDEWQSRWDGKQLKGQWTKKLIPDIREWLKCPHRHLDYFMTQVFSGHGRFSNYAMKMGKREDAMCRYCAALDSVKHTVFQCQKWDRERTEAEAKLNSRLTEDNIMGMILGSQREWTVVKNLVKTILERKEKDERVVD